MERVASLTLLAGAVLVLTWVVAPAAPAGRAPRAAADPDAGAQTSASLVAEVTAQVDRLRERLAVTPPFPPPTRDPFRYGTRPEPPAQPSASAPAPAPVAPPPPPPVLPRLIAVMSSTVNGAVVRSAALSDGDQVLVIKAGDTFGAFVVREIAADSVELAERTGQATFRIMINK